MLRMCSAGAQALRSKSSTFGAAHDSLFATKLARWPIVTFKTGSSAAKSEGETNLAAAHFTHLHGKFAMR